MNMMKKKTLAALLALGMSAGVAGATENNNFTMFDAAGDMIAGEVDNTVTATWDGELGAGHMLISSVDPFYGVGWTAHDITVYGPGTHTVNAIQGAAHDMTFVVGADQFGGHMLFNWGATQDIDVVCVWDVSGQDLISTDVISNWDFDPLLGGGTLLPLAPLATDDVLGMRMVDGAFVGFNANFTLYGVAPAPNTAPVISLVGGNFEMDKCDPYVEPGFSADDTEDGDLTGDVVVTGADLDTCVVGPHTIDYDVADSGGLTDHQERTITVVASGPPTLLVDPLAENVLNGNTAYDELAGVTCTDVEDDPDPTPVVASSNLDVNVDGVYTITYGCTDSDTLVATAVSRTVTVSSNNAPVIGVGADDPATAECGVAYVDAGATCDDVEDGSIDTVDVNNVDTDVLGDSSVDYTCTDNGGLSDTASRVVTVSDTAAPVIERTGEASVTVEIGETYTDDGATCTDTCEDGLTVTVVNPVDTSAIDTYTVTYDCSDSSGNAATQVTRTVNVVEAGGDCVLGGIGGVNNKNNFTMFGPNNSGIVGGSNTVLFEWDGTILETVTTNPADSNAALETDCPFFGIGWRADPVYVYGPGEYTFVTCPAPIVNGIASDGSSTCEDPQLISMTVGEGQLGGHMLFTWGVAKMIDVVNVWDIASKFDFPMAGDCGGGDTNKVWDLVSTDIDGNGYAGAPMVDGPFIGFEANFNVMLPTSPPTIPQDEPVIEILGDNPLVLQQGDEFTCPGAVAVDLRDGALCDQITEVGCYGENGVNTNVPGLYTVNYEVVDSNGNSASDDLQVIVAGAGTSPTPNLIFGETVNHPMILIEGDAVLDLVIAECGGNGYEDAGAAGFDIQDGALGALTGAGSVNLCVPGTYTITYTATDNGGNPAQGTHIQAADSLTTTGTRTVRVNAVPDMDRGAGLVPAQPHGDSDIGCSASESPVNPLHRADLMLVIGFLAMLGIGRAVKSVK